MKRNRGVNAYCEWRSERLVKQYNEAIFNANLEDLYSLTKENLEEALCFFVSEVTKSKGGVPYPGKTLYELVVSIQKYLNVNNKRWKLVDGEDFQTLRTVLDNVIKERTRQNIGTTVKQAEVITFEFEEKLWHTGVLEEQNPDQLRNTVLFLLGINLALHVGDGHYYLYKEMPTQHSQFERNEKS